MTEYRLELNGMSCDSCEKIIRRVADQNQFSIKEIDVKKGTVILDANEAQIDQIKKQLAQKGFPSKTSDDQIERGDPSGVVKYVSSIVARERQVEVETNLINYALGSFLILIILGSLAYSFWLVRLPSASAYLPLIGLSLLGSVLIVLSYYHMLCYRKEMSCTNGMMVGMTVGMIAGFLSGAIIGATNGMFIGSVVGVAIGMGLGGNLGRCCGIMGALEGLMAGLMAGTMGAMLSVMLINDNLIPFMYLLFGASSLILGGLSYMMYREAGVTSKDQLKVNFTGFVLASFLLAGFLILVMFFGPKGPLIYA
ncbi:hypothetical protein HY990_05875 [Candidatus Micrarchaeota archaeon]|nr:hypothetical protein [Candidatus Micrarchaeota archaeon]